MLLSEFNLNIEHKPGSAHRNADSLSRCKQQDAPEPGRYMQVFTLSEASDFLVDEVVELGVDASTLWSVETVMQDLQHLMKEDYLQGTCAVCAKGLANSRVVMCGHCGKA
jgi:hypothetical protein